MPEVKVTAKTTGKIRVFLNGTILIPSTKDGAGKREVTSGDECKVAWEVTGKGSSYEVHVTAPPHAKRDRTTEKSTEEIVNGGFKKFLA